MLNSNSETITMTMDDFRQLVKEEVSKELATIEKPVLPRRLFFSDVSIEPKDISSVNKRFPISDISYHRLNVANRPFMETHLDHVYSEKENRNAIGEATHASEIYTFELHDLIRKLTLSVFGEKRNKDIDPQFYDLAKNYYARTKELWLDMYAERLSVLERQRVSDE